MNKDILLRHDEAFEESLEKIFEWFDEKMYFKIKDELLKYNEADIAEMFEEFLEEEDLRSRTVVVYRLLPKDVSVDVFAYLPSDDQLKIVEGITDAELTYIIQELDFDDKIDILEELPANLVDKILEKTPKDERRLINTFLNYPDNCAGSLMTPDYISLEKEWTVERAMQHIKEVGMDSETIYTAYVLSGGRKLIGIVSLRSLVIAPDHEKVSELMHEDIILAHVDDDQEEVSDLFKRYGFLALPVVDNEGRLVGIITVDDILDVIEEEMTEDIERMGGVIDSTDKEYLDMPVMDHVKAELPWLLLLMCSYFITGGLIARFEDALSSVVALVVYMPMLMGTGGNSGTQTTTLVVRGMSTGEIEMGDALKVFWKEFRVSIVIGICVSAVNFVRIILLDHNGTLVALTVCVSMLLIVIIAKCFGGLLPMGAKKIGIDPALMSGPMMASLTDMVSLGTYFVMAKYFLNL